jgi:uncharacterized membrane protein
MSGSRNTPRKGQDPGTNLSDAKTNTFGIDAKLAALVCYVPVFPFNTIAAILWLKNEDNKFVRFHSIQALGLTAVVMVVGIIVNFSGFILGLIPFIGGALGMVTGFMWLLVVVGFMWLTINCIIDASKGTMTKLPFLGEIADDNA